MLRILAPYLEFEGIENIHVLQVLIWGFGGCWRFLMGFGILILIWIWSLVIDTHMFWILALYLDFEDVKNIHVLQVLIWGFGGFWRFLTAVCYLDLDMITRL